MMLAAMLAMALLVAAPAMAQTTDDSIVEECAAVLSQANEGDVVSQNVSDQTADQRQFAPGGDAQYNVEGDADIEVDTETDTAIIEAKETEAGPPRGGTHTR